MLLKPEITKADRERVKRSSKSLLASIQKHLKEFEDWTSKEQTQADVQVFVLDQVIQSLPQPPYTQEDAESLAGKIYEYVWQRSAAGNSLDMAA